MKMFLEGILVVEGKQDAAYLSNYIASEIVVVNGFEIPESVISYLKNKSVLLLLDPDDAGHRIRQKLKNLLPDAIDVEIDISKCNRGNKKGVAECEINEILDKLHNYVSQTTETHSDIKQSDLYDLGLINNKQLRKDVCEKLNIGDCNCKALYKRLLANNISLKELREIMR